MDELGEEDTETHRARAQVRRVLPSAGASVWSSVIRRLLRGRERLARVFCRDGLCVSDESDLKRVPVTVKGANAGYEGAQLTRHRFPSSAVAPSEAASRVESTLVPVFRLKVANRPTAKPAAT